MKCKLLRFTHVSWLSCIAFLVVCAPALALANRARFWWQEFLVNNALLLFIPCLGACLYICLRRSSGRSSLLLKGLAVVLFVYHGGFLISVLSPYVTADPQLERMRGSVLGEFSVGYIERFESLSQIMQFSDRDNPQILVVHDFPLNALSEMQDIFSDAQVVLNGPDMGILIATKFPVSKQIAPTLGLHAYAGRVLQIRVNKQLKLLLGVLALQPSKNSESLERNRITSRRLATVMRNGEGPRMALLSLSATPLSQFSYIFQDQTDMTSLFYNIGWRGYLTPDKKFGFRELHNIFVSPDMACGMTRVSSDKIENKLIECTVWSTMET